MVPAQPWLLFRQSCPVNPFAFRVTGRRRLFTHMKSSGPFWHTPALQLSVVHASPSEQSAAVVHAGGCTVRLKSPDRAASGVHDGGGCTVRLKSPDAPTLAPST